MAEKKLITRIINKHDTEANWNKASNFAPKMGELIIYDKDASHPYQRMKVGDGSTIVKNLPFIDNHDVKADNVHFTDGKTFQQKLNDGSLKGQDGAPGKNGSQGPQGNAATVSVYSTVTLAEGSNAKVTNMGNSNAANFKFEIPKGEKGDTGATGNSGVIISNDEPLDSTVKVWIKPNESASDFSNFIRKDEDISALQVKFIDGQSFQQKLEDGSLKGGDGKSITHSWSGAKLTLTSASGTTTTDLRGPQGPSIPKSEIQKMINDTLNGVANAEEESF